MRFPQRCVVQDVKKELGARGTPPGGKTGGLSNARREQVDMSRAKGGRASGFGL